MANGSSPGILDRILACEPVGTLFLPHGVTVPAWKRWLGYTARPKGRLMLDAGARDAVVKHGKSLLPVGVVAVSGGIDSAAGAELARGLTNYSSADVETIRGLSSERIADALGTVPYVELIHRDNLVLVG